MCFHTVLLILFVGGWAVFENRDARGILCGFRWQKGAEGYRGEGKRVRWEEKAVAR